MHLPSYLYYFLATLVPRASSFANILILTHLLPLEEYGLFALCIVLGEGLEAITGDWIRVLLQRNEAHLEKNVDYGRWEVLLTASNLVGLVAILIVPLFIVRDRYLEFAIATAAYTITASTLRFYLTCLQVDNRHQLYTKIEFCRSTLILLAIVPAAIFHPSFSAPIAVIIVITGVSAAFAKLMVREPPGSQRQLGDRDYRAQIILGTPIAAAAALKLAFIGVDRVLLQTLLGPEAVGIYAAAYALGRQPVDVVGSAVNMSGFPLLVRAFERDGSEAAGAALKSQLILIVLICLVGVGLFISVGQQIIEILLPSHFWVSAYVVTLSTLLGALCLVLKHFVFDNIFHLYRRNWLGAACMLPGALVTISAAFLLIPKVQITGATFAFALGSFTSLIISAVATRRLLHWRLPVQSIIRILAAVAAMTSIAWTMAAMTLEFGNVVSAITGITTGLAAFLIFAHLLQVSLAKIVRFGMSEA